MKNKSNVKGITLIALVITVIILLILAGVAVSIGLNGGDLFSKANDAKTGWNTKVSEEDQKLGEAWNILNTITNENSGGGSGAGTTTPVPSPTLPVGWNEDSLAENGVYSDGTTDTRVVPIPAGFKVSIYDGETTIADGLVIYETTTALVADEEGSTANHDSAMTTYNQYVWIPVADINDMIMCDSHSSTSDCDIVIDEETGKIYCKNHMTVSDAELTNTTTKFLCGRLYATDLNTTSSSVSTTSMTFDSTAKAAQTYSANSGYREPAVVTGNSSGTGSSYDGSSSYSITKEDKTTSIAGGTNGSNILAELKRQFNNMAKSVATYGGFYISRYEVGYDAIACTSYKGQIVMNSSTTANKGATRWYGLYNHIIGTKGGTTSQMIWGCEYDQVIKFIGSEAQTGHTDRNLYSSSTSGTTSGTTPLDKMKNIYDLEGNYFEWTAQAFNDSYRAHRGGYYFIVSLGEFYPASYREYHFPNYIDSSYSSRQSLYVSL